MVPVFARVALGVSFVLAATAQGAVTRTDPQAIRAAAERYVAAQAVAGVTVHATAAGLDDRLNLAACVGELTPFLPAGATIRPRTRVGVRCPDAAGWSVYVPVDVESEASVAVTRRGLARGEVPAAEDLERVRRRVPGLASQFVADPADIDGRRLRRPLAAGVPVPEDALAAPQLVARGQQVTLVAEAAAVAVRAGAVAVDAGGHGDRIRVRNAVSGRVVEGIVRPDGTVAVGPPVVR